MSLAPIAGGVIGGVISHWLQKRFEVDSAPSPEGSSRPQWSRV